MVAQAIVRDWVGARCLDCGAGAGAGAGAGSGILGSWDLGILVASARS